MIAVVIMTIDESWTLPAERVHRVRGFFEGDLRCRPEWIPNQCTKAPQDACDKAARLPWRPQRRADERPTSCNRHGVAVGWQACKGECL